MKRVAWLLLASVSAVGMLLLFVFPGRTLLAQDREIAAVTQRISALDRETAVLEQRRAALVDPSQIEQIARQRLGLVAPGTRAYVITVPAASVPRTPLAVRGEPRAPSDPPVRFGR